MLPGTVSQYVLHKAECPVMLVPSASYGVLIGNGASRTGLAIGYVVGGGIMIIGGLVEIVFGVDAEGKSLEQVAPPLTVVDG